MKGKTMRIVPVITAILVTAFLYLIIIERDVLMSFVRGDGVDVAALQDIGPDAEPAPQNTAKEEPQGPMAVRVVVQRSVAREVDSAVVLRGETEAARQVTVNAETSGTIISEPLRKGAFVDAGQALCKLDPGTREIQLSEAMARLAEAKARIPETEARVPEAEARLSQALAQLEEAKINQNAASKLSKDGFASSTRVASADAALASAQAGVKAAEAGLKSAQSGMDSVRAGIQSAEAAVANAERELTKLTIKAPFGGLLESDTAELGAYLNTQGGNSQCATIVQLDPIKLVGFVPETEVNRVELGARAGARLAAGGGEVMGRVTFLSRSADPTTRTFRVEIQVPNPDLKIRDGQTAEILIAAEGADAHLLPQSALTLDDGGNLGVRIVEQGNTAKFVPVTLLRDTINGVWLSGLPHESDVIVVGQEYVTDGTPVLPTLQEATQ